MANMALRRSAGAPTACFGQAAQAPLVANSTTVAPRSGAPCPPRRQWHRQQHQQQQQQVASSSGWQRAMPQRQRARQWRLTPLQASAIDSMASWQEDDELGWRTDFDKCYAYGSLIGAGSFGSVYSGTSLRHQHGGEGAVAIKVMPKQRGKLSREKTLDKLAREVDMIERLQACPGVVKLFDCFESPDAVSIVTELCASDLQQFFEAHGSLDERALAHVAFEVLKIVQACHEAGLLHGDVKPANFCLKHPTHNPLASPHLDFASPSAPAWLKAIDFGCSQMLPAHRHLSKRTGTPVYMAPEIYQRDYYHEADMWSVGVMLYQLYARRFPFWDTMEGCKASAFDEVARAVASADIRFDYGPWLHMSHEGRAFVAACLQRDPAQRMTVEEALQHPWLARTLAVPAAPQPQPQQPQQPQAQPQVVVQQHVAKVRATGRPMPGLMMAAGPTPYQQPHQQQHQAPAQQQGWHQQPHSAGQRAGVVVSQPAAQAA